MFTSGDSGAVAVNSATTVPVYDANAAEIGGVADAGLSYSLMAGGAMTFQVQKRVPVVDSEGAFVLDDDDMMTFSEQTVNVITIGESIFNIDSATGVVTYKVMQTTEIIHSINVVATDLAGNTATQMVTISVVDGTITLTITDDVATESGVANIASGDVTFSFNFSENVTGFDKGDITVDGGAKGAFTGPDPGRSYTLVVTPTTGPASGTITVTVNADLATSQTMPTVTNVETVATLEYDTLAPANPVINAPVAVDNSINIAERDEGVDGERYD